MSRSEHSDVSIAGMLLNFCASNFTLQDSLNETLENCKDQKSTIIKFMLICITATYGAIKPGNYLVVSNNGKGKTEDELHDAQEMSNYKDAQEGNHGRFGMGYAAARSVLTQNKGKFLWLSCNSDLTDEEKKNPYMSKKFSEISIDMGESIRQNELVRKARDEISRGHEKMWEDHAIDPFAEGNVQFFPISDDIYTQLKQLFTHENLEQNYCASVSLNYSESIKAGIDITIDGIKIESLPDIEKSNCFEQFHKMYYIPNTWFPLTLPTSNPMITTPIDPFVRKTKGKWYVGYTVKGKNQYVWKELKECCEIKKEKKITVEEIIQSLTYCCDCKSIAIKDKDKLRDVYTKVFKTYGVSEKLNGFKSTIDALVLGDFISREGKFTKIEKDPNMGKVGGNRDAGQNQSMCDVINRICIPTDNKSDKNFGIGNNKSEIKRNNIESTLLDFIMGIKWWFNKQYFKREYEKYLKSKTNHHSLEGSVPEPDTDAVVPKVPVVAPKVPVVPEAAPKVPVVEPHTSRSASKGSPTNSKGTSSLPKGALSATKNTTTPVPNNIELAINLPSTTKEKTPKPASYSERQETVAHNGATKIDTIKKLRKLIGVSDSHHNTLEKELKDIYFKICESRMGKDHTTIFITAINRGIYKVSDHIENIIDIYEKYYHADTDKVISGADIDTLYKKYCIGS